MSKRRLQTALVGRIRVAVPCTASDPASVQSAMDAIKGLVGKLPEGSALEFIGQPDFGKTPVVVPVINVGAIVATGGAPELTVVPEVDPIDIPSHLDRRVPRHG